MAVAPRKDPTTDLIEHSIRTLLAAPRDRSLQLTLRISNGSLSTSIHAVDEDEILERAKNRGVVDMVKRARDVKKVRDACDVARQYFFELQGRDTSEWWREGLRGNLEAADEKKKKRKKGRGRYRRKGKLARVGLPPDPWRDFKIQSLKTFTEIVSWI